MQAPTKVFKIQGDSGSPTKFPILTRLGVSITASGIAVTWNCSWMGSGWERDFLRQFVAKMESPNERVTSRSATQPTAAATARRAVPTPPVRSTASSKSGSKNDANALAAQFKSLPAYFETDLSKLATSLAKFGAWADGGEPFTLEFNYDVVEFDTEVYEQNCDPSMKGKLLKNCGLLLDAAFKKISAAASKSQFAAACTKRTIRFEMHDNYRDARRYWVGVPESDLRSGALAFYCTPDSFLPSRVSRIGDDIEEELESLTQNDDDNDADDDDADLDLGGSDSDSGESRGPVIKECSYCKGRGVKPHNACSGRGCSRCGNRGTTGEKCTNCHGKGHFKYN